MSGYTIYNNTFADVQTGIMLGGGRRNSVKFNHFEKCTKTAIEFDNRGHNYAGPFDKTGDWPTILGALDDPCCPRKRQTGGTAEPPPPPPAECCPGVRKKEPWATRYPDLAFVLEDHPGWPAYNEVMFNTYTSDVVAFQTGMTKDQIAGYLSVVTANVKV